MIEFLEGIHEIVDYHGDFKIRIYPNKEYEDYPQHWHTDPEIIMPVENDYKIVINETTYNLEAEDIIIIPPGELHQLYAPPVGYRIILQFDSTLLYSLSGFNSAFHMFRPCVTVTPSSMPDIHKELSTLIFNITSEYFSTLPFREASAYSMLIRFFTTLGRKCINLNDNLSTMKNQKRHEYLELFFNVCNYINEHCTEDIKMDNLADIAGFSKYHFTRLFKEVMNISCYDYLINRRIMCAEKLLINPALTITQVAMKSGFSSLATFNRVFKAKNRCTPTEYKSFYEVN
ncbi:helix-turn-helix domain-containing protein [Anaerocolumna sp. AGMB13025]|uniref:AraC family transcriptional regulator n=1 Tax=Anaerocolumna sp. AGMB13025 TaxID=3039116 RepID=UPI00241BFBB6|nr:AraC family transcriptional regulator [Anaerocolumna sp. AGMB13025]WFR55556.1 helix-turn-helix domain-containing protein [Anaerocolumna sp. AGMB13025]